MTPAVKNPGAETGADPLAVIRRRRRAAAVDVNVNVGGGQLAATNGPLGVYVHFPFCTVHCPYCDFAVDVRGDIPHDRYADAVVAELVARAAWFGGRIDGDAKDKKKDIDTDKGDCDRAKWPRLASIYFGGGTPALWRPIALRRVIDAATRIWDAGRDGAIEITVEANPGEVDETGLRALRAAGVNRVSLGLQALDDRLLRAIGRNHDAAAGPAAVRAVRAAGVDNLSIDLMFGLPGQSQDDWRRSVEGVLALRPEHVSAYALTVERATPFGTRARRGELVVPDDEEVAAMQVWARDALAADGLLQYEVSSYARSGKRAVHNGLYWTGAPYLGVGASAASFRPLADGTGWRFSNPRSTETYLRANEAGAGSPAPSQAERRSGADLENEAVWLALRTIDGLDRAAHARRFGEDPLASRAPAIQRCAERGWLQVDAIGVRPTPAGLLFADEVAVQLWR